MNYIVLPPTYKLWKNLQQTSVLTNFGFAYEGRRGQKLLVDIYSLKFSVLYRQWHTSWLFANPLHEIAHFLQHVDIIPVWTMDVALYIIFHHYIPLLHFCIIFFWATFEIFTNKNFVNVAVITFSLELENLGWVRPTPTQFMPMIPNYLLSFYIKSTNARYKKLICLPS